MRVWFSILMVAVLLVSLPGGAVAADLTSLSLSPPNVTGGTGVTGTVTVSSASQKEITIRLQSSNPTVATVPGSVTVAPGAVTATFPVTTKPVGQTSTVTISGKLGGKTTAAALAVTPIVPITIAPTSVTLNPSSVAGGANVTGQVTLSGPAPAGGLAVALATSHPTVATVPAGVTVAPGASTATFPVTTKPVIQNSTVTIAASAGGATTAAALAVTPIVPITIAPTSVTLNPSSVAGGANVTGQVTLSGPAPAVGLAVGLASSNPTVATVPAGVTVAPGASTATFPVTTKPVIQSSTVTIAASAGGATRTAALAVLSGAVVPTSVVPTTVILSPSSVAGGANVTGQVTLSGPAPAVGLAVALATSHPAVATVPAGVTVAPGASTATFPVTTKPVGQTTTVSIITSAGGGGKEAALTVTPIVPITVVPTTVILSPSSVAGGANVTGQVTLSGPAPAGGLAVALATSHPTVATVPAGVTVAPGASTATFPVTTKPVIQNSTVTISASAGGATRGASLQVLGGAVVPTSVVPTTVILSPSSVTGGANVTGQVTLSGPAPAGGLAIFLHSTDTRVATVPEQVAVGPGASAATFPVQTKPVAQSSLVGIVASAGGVTRGAQFQVNAPVVPTSGVVLTSVTLSQSRVVVGETVTGHVTLSGPAAGGLVVGIRSTNPTVVSVPASVTVAPGASTATFTFRTNFAAQTYITASAGAVSRSAELWVLPVAIVPTSVTFNPISVVGGATVTGHVTLSGPAPAGGLAVGLSTSNPTVAAVPAGVTVGPGASIVAFPVQTYPVGQTSTVTISASAGGKTTAATLTVTPIIRQPTILSPPVKGEEVLK